MLEEPSRGRWVPDFATIREYLETASWVVVILGVPTALWSYAQTRHKDRETKEYETYNALDEKFLDFQRFCLEHPYLDVFDVKDKAPVALTDLQKKEELIAFTILFAIFERAFVMYRTQQTDFRQRQWSGWQEYIDSFCRRDNFVRAWERSGNTFDQAFQDYMIDAIARCRPEVKLAT